jgi:hypothetical protein
MKTKLIWTLVFVFAISGSLVAQTKVSGTHHCSKAEVEQMIQVGDKPNHTFMINQEKCVWTKPMEMAGIQSKEGLDTSFYEMTASSMQFNGFHISTMDNGDKAYVRYHGTVALKDGKSQGASGTWMYVGGTGKLKGITGKGTFKGTSEADGSSTNEVEGEYSLPAAK